MEPKSPSKLKLSITKLTQSNRKYKTIITILLLVIVILFGIFFATKSSNIDQHDRSLGDTYYTVVVDCGSTGTRVSIFEWVSKRDQDEIDLPVLLHSYPDFSSKFSENSCKYHCSQTEPGLDKFFGNRSGVRVSLEPLIIQAEKIVPVEKHVKTPIFVLATEGLRRLGIERASRVLDDVEVVLKEICSFSYRKSWIRVLSGREEAYYGWVALNYKLGVFENRSMPSSLGLLDLGGSSLQVVIEVLDHDLDVKEDDRFVGLRFGSVNRGVLAESLPAFGLNEAFDRTVVLLSHTEAIRVSWDGSLELRHPCFGSGFLQNYTCRGCSEEKSELFSLKIVGEPNWDRCKMLAVSAATNSSALSRVWSTPGVEHESRLCVNIGNKGLPNLRFHALSGFFIIFDTLNLSSPIANSTEIWETSRDFSTRSWVNKEISLSKAQYCFRVSYMASLIEDSLCLGDKEIVFGPADVSWSLGAAIIEGEYQWSDSLEDFRVHKTEFYWNIISSPVFAFVFLVCSLSVVFLCQVRFPMPGKRIS